MKVTREQAAENRERILDVAATLFRERGFDGIGVADLMKEAGLTHGGFYGHFESKEDLMAEACTRAMQGGIDLWEGIAKKNEYDPLTTIKARYLSSRHRDDPGAGCLIASLGTEVPRQGGKVRRSVTEGISALIDLFARLSPGNVKARKREEAIATLTSLVGAVVLARAVNEPALSKEILRVAGSRASL